MRVDVDWVRFVEKLRWKILLDKILFIAVGVLLIDKKVLDDGNNINDDTLITTAIKLVWKKKN